MNVFEFVVVIVLIAAVARVVQQVLQNRHVAATSGDDPTVLRARDEVRELKERIQVLERVITDNHGSHRLDDEIERLRDR